jgi:hypothetical protein
VKYKRVSFFDVFKILPKSIILYDEDDNLTLSLVNSVIKVTKKKINSQHYGYGAVDNSVHDLYEHFHP